MRMPTFIKFIKVCADTKQDNCFRWIHTCIYMHKICICSKYIKFLKVQTLYPWSCPYYHKTCNNHIKFEIKWVTLLDHQETFKEHLCPFSSKTINKLPKWCSWYTSVFPYHYYINVLISYYNVCTNNHHIFVLQHKLTSWPRAYSTQWPLKVLFSQDKQKQ